MMAVQGVAFLTIGVLLLLLVALAIVRIGFLRLESPLGIIRDGLPTGSAAPRWALPDLDDRVHQVPRGTGWQFLFFADRSIKEFPSITAGVEELRAKAPEVEFLLLPKARADLAVEAATGIGLRVPVVPVDREFYWRHNVRVMPFALVLSPDGRVRAAGLASDRERIAMIWRMSQLPGSDRWTVQQTSGLPAGLGRQGR